MLVGAGDSFENQRRRPKQQSDGHKVLDLRHVREHQKDQDDQEMADVAPAE